MNNNIDSIVSSTGAGLNRRDFLKLLGLATICYPLQGCDLDSSSEQKPTWKDLGKDGTKLYTEQYPNQTYIDAYIEKLVELKKAEYDVVTSEILMKEMQIEYKKKLNDTASKTDDTNTVLNERTRLTNEYNNALIHFNNLRTKDEEPKIEDIYRKINALMGDCKNNVINLFLLEHGYIFIKEDTRELKDNTYFILQDEFKDEKNPLEIRSLDRLGSLYIGKILSVNKEDGKEKNIFHEMLPFYNSYNQKKKGKDMSFKDSIGNEYKKVD